MVDQHNMEKPETEASSEQAGMARLEARLEALERYETVEERLAELENRTTSSRYNSVTGFLALGFGSFGIAIGLLTGLTQSEIVKPLIVAMFALIGGSLVAFLHKLSNTQQGRAGIALALISIGLAVGVLSGIVVREHRLLGGADQVVGEATKNAGQGNRAFSYLRSEQTKRCNEIDEERQRNRLNAEEAYEAMYTACLMNKTNAP